MKANHIVFVHGLFGWGPGELGGIPYWGGALESVRQKPRPDARSQMRPNQLLP